MTKQQIIEFGVPEERYKDFSELYHADLRKAAKRMHTDSDYSVNIRKAAAAVMNLISDEDTLEIILNFINSRFYNTQMKGKQNVPEDNDKLQHTTGSGTSADSSEAVEGSNEGQEEAGC